jgi:parvulin-like peptidyl-prolyl isomerase
LKNLFCFAFLAVVAVGCTAHRLPTSDHVVLKVNDRELAAHDFADELAARLRIYDALTAKDETNVQHVKDAILRDFIIQSVSEDYARDANLIVKKEELDNEINSIRSNYPNDEAFRTALADQHVDFKRWTEKVRLTLLNKRIITRLRSGVAEPTLAELQTYYKGNRSEFQTPDQVRLRQVVLANESDAEAVLAEIQRGRSIKDLAPQFSIAAEASREGDTGWLDKGTLDVFDRAFKMDKRQRSPVLKSDFGYHIFEVLDKRRAQVTPFEEVKDRIRRTLIERREQAAYTKWLEAQIQKAHVFRDDAFIAKMKVETRSE